MQIFRDRCFFITVQGPKGRGTDWRFCWPSEWQGKYDFRTYVYELGREATSPHIHILIYFHNLRTSNRLAANIMKINPGCEISVERRRGTWKEALDYIDKQDETKIDGMPPVREGKEPREKERKMDKEERMKMIVDTIKDSGLKGLVENDAEAILKYSSGCKTIRNLVGPSAEKRSLEVTIVWGDAGTGKSTWCQQEAFRKWEREEVYFYTKVGGARDTTWFNGYMGQQCIILDDICGRTMQLEYILKITGNDPIYVENKRKL
uniref:Rep n=1 Tax=CRESS DNA virus TaxID=3138951 RepID=A0AAU8H4Q9_9VIRU